MCSKKLGKATDHPTCQASFSEKMSPLRGLAFVHFIAPRAGTLATWNVAATRLTDKAA
jgi:hypothetical protein